MNPLVFPWLQAIFVLLIVGAVATARRPDLAGSRSIAVTTSLAALGLAIAAAIDFRLSLSVSAAGPGLLFEPSILRRTLFELDSISMLLLPVVPLIFSVLLVAAPGARNDPARWARLLAMEGLTLGVLVVTDPFVLWLFWALVPIPLLGELSSAPDGAPLARELVRRGGLASSALLGGGLLLAGESTPAVHAVAGSLVALALLIRQGIFPFHSWIPALFESAPFGVALCYCLPQVAACVGLRRLFGPISATPDWLLGTVMTLALFTAIYASALALIQTSARRAFGFLVCSQSSLVMAGLASTLPEGSLGGLTCWITSGLALAGFGLILGALEARRGPLLLDRYHGGHSTMPMLAAGALILGLASVGLPGTLGFVGIDLLSRGTLETSPVIGLAVVLASALNGIRVLSLYWRLFCGQPSRWSPALELRPRERVAILVLLAVLFLGGLVPQPILSLEESALEVVGAGHLPRNASSHHVR